MSLILAATGLVIVFFIVLPGPILDGASAAAAALAGG